MVIWPRFHSPEPTTNGLSSFMDLELRFSGELGLGLGLGSTNGSNPFLNSMMKSTREILRTFPIYLSFAYTEQSGFKSYENIEFVALSAVLDVLMIFKFETCGEMILI